MCGDERCIVLLVNNVARLQDGVRTANITQHVQEGITPSKEHQQQQ